MKHTALLLLPFILSSCSSAFYTPNSQNVPMLQEKNEARVTTGYLAGESFNGFELQAAYSPANHVGLMASYTNAWAGEQRGQQIDGGVGGYAHYGNHFGMEGYLGLASATLDLGDGQEHFTKYYVQPAIAFTSNYFDFIFSTRFGGVNIQGTDSRSRSSALIEPAITLRGGYKWVKVQAQYCFSYLSNESDISHDYNIVSLGLSFNIAPRFRPQSIR